MGILYDDDEEGLDSLLAEARRRHFHARMEERAASYFCASIEEEMIRLQLRRAGVGMGDTVRIDFEDCYEVAILERIELQRYDVHALLVVRGFTSKGQPCKTLNYYRVGGFVAISPHEAKG